MTAASDPNTPRAGAPWPILVIRLAYFALVVAGAVYVWRGHVHITRWADEAALGASLVCILASGRLLVESFDRRTLAKRMMVEGETTSRETAQVRLQSMVILALGFILILPNLAFGYGWPPEIAYGAIMAFVIARAAYTWHIVKTGDEFLKRRIHESAWWILIILTTGLLLYAGAERLGLAPVITGWDVLVVLMIISLVVPSFVAARYKPRPAAKSAKFD